MADLKTALSGNSAYVLAAEKALASVLDGQKPSFTVVSCCDSRVVPEEIFGMPGPGRIFVIRNIGNQLSTAQGSVDYGVHHLKTPILVIKGHTGCGAIKAASGDYSDQNPEIRRELDTLSKNLHGPKDSLLDQARRSQQNVDAQVTLAVARYPHTQVVGMLFDLHNLLGGGYGRAYVTNIGGVTDVAKISSNPIVTKEAVRRL